jgi:hypothetical protein
VKSVKDGRKVLCNFDNPDDAFIVMQEEATGIFNRRDLDAHGLPLNKSCHALLGEIE